MADDLSEKIRAVLSDPASAAAIASIASSLGAGGNTAEEPKNEPQQESVPSSVQSVLPLLQREPDRNTALLCAIKPFLREEKRDKLDSLIRALSVAEIISGMKRGGGI